MRLRGPAAVVAAVVAVWLAAVPLALRAQSSPPPDTEFVPAVWVATSAGLVKVAQADGTLLLEIAEPAGVRTVAVDAARSLVWAYTPGMLRAYTLGGIETRLVPMPVPSDYTDATPVALAVNPTTGAAWLSIGTTLRQLDATGGLLTAQSLVEAPKVLVYDPVTSRLWVGTEHQVVALNDAGAQVASLNLDHDTVHDLAVDPTNGDLWLASSNSLARYDATTLAVEADTRIPSLKWVATDGTGGAWQTTPQNLFRLDASGQTLVALDPWPGPGPLVAVASDTGDASAWVASATAVSHVSTTGQIDPVVTLPSSLRVRKVATYADRAAPTIQIVQPAAGVALATSTPTVEVSWADPASGVDPDSLELAVDGLVLAATCTATEVGAACTLGAALVDGEVVLSATVRDRAGNASDPAQVAFTIDTVVPVVSIAAPMDGAATRVGQKAVAGTTSEAVTVTVWLNGAAVETRQVPAGPFTLNAVTLVEGANQIEVRALDRAGNAGAAQVAVILDTLPPAAVSAQQVTLGEVVEGDVTVSGAAGSAEPGAHVTITNLRTLQSVTVVAAADGSFSTSLAGLPGDSFQVVVQDAAGNASEPIEFAVPAARSPFVDAAWVGTASGLLKVAADDGGVLVRVTEPGITALAVNDWQNRVWTYRPGALILFDLEGTRFRTVAISLPDDPSAPVSLTTTPDGSVWLSVGALVRNVGPDGLVRFTKTLPEPVTALAAEPNRGYLWMATASGLGAYQLASPVVTDPTAPPPPRGLDLLLRVPVDVTGLGPVADLAWDEYHGALWAAFADGLRRYGSDGTLRAAVALSAAPRRLAVDDQGRAWAAAAHGLVRVTTTGAVDVVIDPWPGDAPLVDVAGPARAGAVWTATAATLTRLDEAGGRVAEVPLASDGEGRAVGSYADRWAPSLSVLLPGEGDLLDTNTPALSMQATDRGSGISIETLTLTVNGQPAGVSCAEPSGSQMACALDAPLPEGVIELEGTVEDRVGNQSSAAARRFTVDTVPPTVRIAAPIDGRLTQVPGQALRIEASEPVTAEAWLDDTPVTLRSQPGNVFEADLVLVEGANTIRVRVTDALGRIATAEARVTLDTTEPNAPDADGITVTEPTGGVVTVSGDGASVEPNAWVTIRNLQTGETVRVRADATGGFVATIGAAALDEIRITAEDEAGNVGAPTDEFVGGFVPGVPPDPATLAPQLDTTVATDLASATAFLYTGANRIQFGVGVDTIEPRRAAVLRGRVTDRAGEGLAGVRVAVLEHPELGWTQTRTDGAFDLAVNGGGPLTVTYDKGGYLSAQRQVAAPWQAYAWLQEVVLVQLDERVTPVDLGGASGMQVARGNPVTDAAGTRTATILFPPGTTATLRFRDGTSRPLAAGAFRATEYTVGANGPAAMPALLPPTTGYTYAVEYSFDEALAAKAVRVDFNQPVLQYVDNFLGFPVGGIVPVGYYDTARAAWVASKNGRVVKIVGITDGRAVLDVTGAGTASDPATLAALGVTDPERVRIAELYAEGHSLWRVPIPHFSTWDSNWGIAPEPGAEPPTNEPPTPEEVKVDKPTCGQGSVIECENQVLGETIRIVGTPFTLNYRSDRQQGRRALSSALLIPLTGPTVPPTLRRVELEVEVAGQKRTWSYSQPGANLTHRFEWDGRDAFGRSPQGGQPVTVRVGYTYRAVYREPAQIEESFGYNGNGVPITVGPYGRSEMTLWQEFGATVYTALGGWDARPQGFGGWTLDVHHAYDPKSKSLYLGSGGRRTPETLRPVVTTVAGNGSFTCPEVPDGTPATATSLPVDDTTLGPDGSLYVLGCDRVRQVAPDGRVFTVAGNGTDSYSGDDGPALLAGLGGGSSIALGPDGSLLVAEGTRIRRIGRDGIIRRIAGTGEAGFSGDGGPATEAKLSGPHGLTVAPDGTVYFADRFNHRVRSISPGGTIRTVAGSGVFDESRPQEGPATAIMLQMPYDIALDARGYLYIAEHDGGAIRRVAPDGYLTTVAGPSGFPDDGILASQANVSFPIAIALGPDGSLYYAETLFANRVRRIAPDGIVTTVVGQASISSNGFHGDNGPAAAARVSGVSGIGAAPDGTLYLADSGNGRVRAVALPFPEFEGAVVPAEDGSALYVLDAQGRHQRTLDTRTGAPIYRFEFDQGGRLVHVFDRVGLETRIERDSAGQATAIVASGGQRTVLTYDVNGYLASVENPAHETIRLTSDPTGLLTEFRNARDYASTFTYDGLGRLRRDANAAGGSFDLGRTEHDDGYTATLSSALGRTTTYEVEHLPDGRTQRRVVAPDQIGTLTVVGTDEGEVRTAPDGTVIHTTRAPDPRFGMRAPTFSQTVTLPSGLSSTVESSRTATFGPSPADPMTPLPLVTQTETTRINGRLYTSTYDAATRTITSRTPAGRTAVTTLDDLGRPVRIVMPGLAARTMVYDVRGRLEAVTEGEGVDARVTRLAYDEADRLASVTDAEDRVVAFGRDAANRVVRQVLPDLQEIGLGYDGNGNVTAVTPPGRPAHGFTYTPVDLEASYTPPGLADVPTPTTAYTYNTDKQPTLVTRPNGQTISFGYGTGGRLATITQPRGTTTLAYEPGTGRLAGVTAPDGGTLANTYDGSLLTSVTWGSGRVSGSVAWTYDADFRVATEAVSGAQSITYTYDPDSLVTGAGALTLARDPQIGFLTGTTLGLVTDSRTYTAFGEPETYRADVNGSPVLEIAYVRDALGRIVEKTETIEGVTTVTDYRYDDAGRLDQVTVDGVVTATYTYDANGNRLSATTPSGTGTGTYDAQDRLLSDGGATYTYTANGELRTKTDASGTTTYTYDLVGNLTRVDLPDGREIEYVIDGQNRRLGKTIDGVLVQEWLYRDQLKPVAELDGSGQIVARFVYGSNPLVPDYIVKGGATYRLLTDHLGSPRLVVDTATGTVIQRRDYNEWGLVAFDSNPGFQPFGIAGGLNDPDTHLVRFGARDYDPRTGRWTAKDPIGFWGRQANLYTYAFSNPITFIDPSGEDPFVGVWVGLVAGAASGAYAAIVAGGDKWDIITGLVVGGTVGAAVGLVDVTGGALTVQATLALVGAEAGFFSALVSPVAANALRGRPLDCNVSLRSAVVGATAGAAGGLASASVAIGLAELGATATEVAIGSAVAGGLYDVSTGALLNELVSP